MVRQTYMEEIHRRTTYVPTWLPGKQRRLGDVGTYEDGVFRRKRTLGEYDIEHGRRRDETPTDYALNSSEGFTFESTLSGESAREFEALGKAEAGARIEFDREHAYAFVAKGCREHEIADKRAVERAILKRADEQSWRTEYAVVTELVEADSLTVLVAGAGGGTVELRASGAVGNNGIHLGDISAGVELAHTENMALEVIADEEVTPLYRTMRLEPTLWERFRDLLFGRPEYHDSGPIPTKTAGMPPIEDEMVEAVFTEVTPADMTDTDMDTDAATDTDNTSG